MPKIFCFIAATLLLVACGKNSKPIQIRTDPAPITNRFPALAIAHSFVWIVTDLAPQTRFTLPHIEDHYRFEGFGSLSVENSKAIASEYKWEALVTNWAPNPIFTNLSRARNWLVSDSFTKEFNPVPYREPQFFFNQDSNLIYFVMHWSKEDAYVRTNNITTNQ